MSITQPYESKSKPLLVDEVLGDTYLTVKFVAENIETIKTLAGNSEDLSNLGPLSENLETLSNDLALLQNIIDNYSIIQPVGENIADVVSLNAIRSEIETAVADLTNIITVAGSIVNVNTVAAVDQEVVNISGSLTDLIALFNAIPTIQANRDSAEQSATDALSYKVDAETAATNAATSESNAASSANAASTSATESETSNQASQTASNSAAQSLSDVQALAADLLQKSENLSGLSDTQQALVNLGAIPTLLDVLFNTENSKVLDVNSEKTIRMPNGLQISYKTGITTSVTASADLILTSSFENEFESAPLVIPIVSPNSADYPVAGLEKTSLIRLVGSVTDVTGFWYSGDDGVTPTGDIVWGYIAIGLYDTGA